MIVEELYDVLDSKGNKIGSATWKEIHSRGLLHQVVAALIFKDECRDELLLQRRAYRVQDPGLWNHSAGGHMASGEMPLEAMLRELQEELFFEHKFPDLAIRSVGFFAHADRPNNNEILHLFEVFYKGPFYYNKDEVSEEPIWIKWDDLLHDITLKSSCYTVSFKNTLEYYLHKR